MTEHYDLLYILPGTKTDDEVKPMIDAVRAIVTEHGATDVKTDFWGKRKLAYEINGLRSGFYDLVQFDLETTKLQALDKVLGLNEHIVRHQVTRRKVLTPEQIAAETALRERIAARQQAVKDQEAAATIKAESDASMLAAPAPVSTPAPAAPSEPVTPEQLDKKLEELLENDTLNV